MQRGLTKVQLEGAASLAEDNLEMEHSEKLDASSVQQEVLENEPHKEESSKASMLLAM